MDASPARVSELELIKGAAGKPTGLRIVVLGYIVRGPMGGLVWHHLQYVLGLACLGHDVFFFEDSGDSEWCCYDPDRHVTDTDPSYGLRFIDAVFKTHNLAERWAYYDAHRRQWHGLEAQRRREVLETADLLIDISGVNEIRDWYERIQFRALIDTDPAFTQIRHIAEPAARSAAAVHTSFFTFGENVSEGRWTVPDDGFAWRATRQPVVLEAWPLTRGKADGFFTTVMQWDSYEYREHGGLRYGMKSESFLPFLELPALIGPRFKVAVGGDLARQALLSSGWRIVNPLIVARTADSYQRFIKRSKAEFGVAKHGYVITRCGWFSERTAGYLASGRPVVVQDTGFSDWLSTGKGVHAFDTPEAVCVAIDRIDTAYDEECKAAREIAREYFDYSKVLPPLIEGALGRHSTEDV